MTLTCENCRITVVLDETTVVAAAEVAAFLHAHRDCSPIRVELRVPAPKPLPQQV